VLAIVVAIGNRIVTNSLSADAASHKTRKPPTLRRIGAPALSRISSSRNVAAVIRTWRFAYFMARLTGARRSVMFSALAAEAYINRFLHNRLSGGDLKTAMNIRRPAEKFAAGTRLALGQTLFPRDEDIYERLEALFTLRQPPSACATTRGRSRGGSRRAVVQGVQPARGLRAPRSGRSRG
jgi:hypothetical protein